MPISDADLFHPSTWKKHFSLIPVVTICGGACVMATCYVGYMLMYKHDISLRPSRWKEDAPYKYVEPDQVVRLKGYNKEISYDPEIVALRKEIGSYKAK
jgi:hypothetical protein